MFSWYILISCNKDEDNNVTICEFILAKKSNAYQYTSKHDMEIIIIALENISVFQVVHLEQQNIHTAHKKYLNIPNLILIKQHFLDNSAKCFTHHSNWHLNSPPKWILSLRSVHDSRKVIDQKSWSGYRFVIMHLVRFWKWAILHKWVKNKFALTNFEKLKFLWKLMKLSFWHW